VLLVLQRFGMRMNKVTKEGVLEQIKLVFDPEIPVNVHDLGLIYEVNVDGNDVEVLMTLTSPNCPVAQELPKEIAKSIRHISEIKDLRVRVVWDPPWNQSMMSDIAKLSLNLL